MPTSPGIQVVQSHFERLLGRIRAGIAQAAGPLGNAGGGFGLEGSGNHFHRGLRATGLGGGLDINIGGIGADSPLIHRYADNFSISGGGAVTTSGKPAII